MMRMSVDDGMLRYTNVSLKDCIRIAYRVKDWDVLDKAYSLGVTNLPPQAFVQLWTGTDEKVPSEDARAQAFVRIARKYALPRPWKLSDPVAVESHRLRPSNWKWATAIEAVAARSVA